MLELPPPQQRRLLSRGAEALPGTSGLRPWAPCTGHVPLIRRVPVEEGAGSGGSQATGQTPPQVPCAVCVQEVGTGLALQKGATSMSDLCC